MSRHELYITQSFYANAVKKGIYLVLLHANRVPPHIGMMIDNEYHSLTIKGQELSISGNALLKNIGLRKIPTVFIKIKKPTVDCELFYLVGNLFFLYGIFFTDITFLSVA